MSYAIYNTEAFVLKHRTVGEANVLVWLYTKRFGLLLVHVQSGRKHDSKLKQALGLYSYIKVALVRGKNIWRVTSAEEVFQISAVHQPQQLILLARVFKIIERFVTGQEPDEEMFTILETIYKKIISYSSVEQVSLLGAEYAVVSKILFMLGYVQTDAVLIPVIEHPCDEKMWAYVEAHKKHFLAVINNALKISHL